MTTQSTRTPTPWAAYKKSGDGWNIHGDAGIYEGVIAHVIGSTGDGLTIKKMDEIEVANS